jgi:hypothetical protein
MFLFFLNSLELFQSFSAFFTALVSLLPSQGAHDAQHSDGASPSIRFMALQGLQATHLTAILLPVRPPTNNQPIAEMPQWLIVTPDARRRSGRGPSHRPARGLPGDQQRQSREGAMRMVASGMAQGLSFRIVLTDMSLLHSRPPFCYKTRAADSKGVRSPGPLYAAGRLIPWPSQ